MMNRTQTLLFLMWVIGIVFVAWIFLSWQEDTIACSLDVYNTSSMMCQMATTNPPYLIISAFGFMAIITVVAWKLNWKEIMGDKS